MRVRRFNYMTEYPVDTAADLGLVKCYGCEQFTLIDTAIELADTRSGKARLFCEECAMVERDAQVEAKDIENNANR